MRGLRDTLLIWVNDVTKMSEEQLQRGSEMPGSTDVRRMIRKILMDGIKYAFADYAKHPELYEGDRKPADDFDHVWVKLAEEGKCDSIGGAEWLRVKGEWKRASEPRDIRGFIENRANS